MKIFKKRISAARDQAIGRIAGTFRESFGRLQKRWADWMAMKFNGRSKRTLLVGLSLFVAFSMIYNGWVLIGSPRGSEIRVGSIKIPKNPEQPQILRDAYTVELKRIRTFRKFMDSIRASPDGRIVYDSIMKARPGLLDSARSLENLIGIK